MLLGYNYVYNPIMRHCSRDLYKNPMFKTNPSEVLILRRVKMIKNTMGFDKNTMGFDKNTMGFDKNTMGFDKNTMLKQTLRGFKTPEGLKTYKQNF